MNLSNLTAAQLRQAAGIAEKIDTLNAELSALLGSSETTVSLPGKRGPKKGGMSATGRARIAAAQKARWVKAKAQQPEATKAEKPAKRKMSAAGRAAIIAAQKARWANAKAAKAEAKVEPKPGKRTMSAAGRLAISKAAKARWAKAKAEKQS